MNLFYSNSVHCLLKMVKFFLLSDELVVNVRVRIFATADQHFTSAVM